MDRTLKYLLTPLIDILSCSSGKCCCCPCCRLPRGVAVVLAFMVAIWIVFILGSLVARSVETFIARSGQYTARLEALLELFFTVLESAQTQVSTARERVSFLHDDEDAEVDHSSLEKAKVKALEYLKSWDIPDLILSLLGQAAHIAEDVMYIVLFLVFMLAHTEPDDSNTDPFARKVNRQVFLYIRGKTAICLFAAVVNSYILWSIGFDLFLAFGVMTFFLNFVPNIGMGIGIILPMPLIALDPSFSVVQTILAFIGPLVVGTFAKDVLEPLVLGKSASLHPVCVLLAILLYGSVWGLTGMVLAVPLTAVLKIYLEAVDHPLPRFIAAVLSGKKQEERERTVRHRAELV